MSEPVKKLTEEQKKAIAFLKRPKPGLSDWWKEECRKEVAALKNLQPGQAVAGQGVFIGIWQPKDREGHSLGKVFNVFAAPQDLTDASGNKETYKYVDAVKRISELKNWNGFDGTNYATDIELYKALKEDSYSGGWIIPTRDLLSGFDVTYNKTQQDNICDHKDKGALRGTFTETVAPKDFNCPHFYWSCTEHYQYQHAVYSVRLYDSIPDWNHKQGDRLSCRPVRLVPVAG